MLDDRFQCYNAETADIIGSNFVKLYRPAGTPMAAGRTDLGLKRRVPDINACLLLT
jgi:hypothetical protein